MALTDLKSDLSKFRKPLKTDPIEKQKDARKPKKFVTTPLADRVPPNTYTSPQSPQKVGKDVAGNNPAGRHTQGTDIVNAPSPGGRHTNGADTVDGKSPSGRHTQGADTVAGKSPSGRHEVAKEVPEANSPTGRHEVAKEVPTGNAPSGRHETAREVPEANSPSGRHEIGKDVPSGNSPSGRHETAREVPEANSPTGRHETGKEVPDGASPSGRHTVGKEVPDGASPSGRHESDTSGLNIDGKVPVTNPAGRHDGADTSGLNYDGKVPNTNPAGRHDGPDTSGLNYDGTVPLTNPRGRHTQGVDNPNTSPITGRHDGDDTSQLNYDGTVPLTNPTGRHTVGEEVTNTSPLTGRHDSGDTSIKNIDGVPNKYSNTVGEGKHYPNHDGSHSTKDIDGPVPPTNPRGRHDAGDTSQFNIDGVPTKYSNTVQPYGLHENSHVSEHTTKDIEGVPNKYSNTIGTGIHSDTNVEVTNLSPQTSRHNTLPVPPGSNPGKYSKFDLEGDNPFVKEHNFVENNSDKFQASRTYKLAKKEQSYTGLYQVGTRKLEAQLGEGTFAPGAPGLVGHEVKMKASDLGYHGERKYSTIVGVSSLSALGHQYIQKNSPSFLDAQYSKFKVRDEAFNPSYIGHPLILRGIQRNGEAGYEPQRWGFGLNFDDGLIRGGIVTSVERAAVDTARIAKFMASPKGILWVIKQVGLGFSNPKVETSPDTSAAGIMGTRIHTGITSLLSVAGTAFGLHFTTHGIPFKNEGASYENVMNQKQRVQKDAADLIKQNTIKGSAGGFFWNRLAKYTHQMIEKNQQSPGSVLGSENPLFFKEIQDIGFGGAQSTYGLLPHTVKKKSTVTPEWKDLEKASKNPVEMGIKAYSTLAYADLKRDENKIGTSAPQDFRNKLDGGFQASGRSDNAGLSGNDIKVDLNYEQTNLVNTHGWGEHGKYGEMVDRRDYTYVDEDEEFRGDKINIIDYRGKIPYGDIYKSINSAEPKDFVKFYFTGPTQIGKGGKNDASGGEEEVLVFRNTVGNIQDQFSPSWQGTQILGRADQVHVYSGWGRSFSFDFKVQATSRREMYTNWRKLNYLASWTAPRYTSGGLMRGPYIRFTLGHIFQETPCFINNLTISTDTATPWEINLEDDKNMLQLPHGVTVSMGLTMLMDYRPQWGGRMYSLSTRGRLEDGEGENWLSDSTSESDS